MSASARSNFSGPLAAPMPLRTTRFRWLLGVCLLAMTAVTGAGLWGIAVARRGVVDHATTVFRLGIAERARTIESALSGTRAELGFLAGSAPLSDLDTALRSERPEEVRWRRMWAEAALILFLRAHPEISHLVIDQRVGAGEHPGEEALVAVGRRGGIPVAWRPSGASALEAGSITTEAPLTTAPGGALRLVAGVDIAALLRSHAVGGGDVACTVRGPDGGALGSIERSTEEGIRPWEGRYLRADAELGVEGWSRPGPWTLSCAQRESAAIGVLTPLVDRYRLTLALNLAVMTLTVLLGVFAIRQMRRRERLEWAAGEDARVREMERQLFHSERLATVGRLAAGFAHEINNPLEGVYNYLHLAGDSMRRGDREAALRRLDRVREGLERMSGVVGQILAHSDPAAGRKAQVDLRTAATQAVDLVRTRKEFGGIRFDLDLADDVPEVIGHPVLLGQVLLNLVLNACEAQPGGGEVRVTMRFDGAMVTLDVADRGPGVSPDHAVKIFEPFFSTKGSTGLGLSICHTIVRQHGGELSILARDGGGALLRLRLPARPAVGSGAA